jgi:sortase A
VLKFNIFNTSIVNTINDNKDGIAVINIEKIDLKETIYEDTIKSTSIKGIVLFKEYGRPNIEYSNTIIGAHSGNGKYSLFTDLDKLDNGDSVFLTYKGTKYTYKVIDVSLVYKTNNKILNNIKDKTTLTLFTCNEKNDN